MGCGTEKPLQQYSTIVLPSVSLNRQMTSIMEMKFINLNVILSRCTRKFEF